MSLHKNNIESTYFESIWRKLTENQQRFVMSVRQYRSKKACAEALGLIPDTVYRWPDYVDKAVELYGNHIVDAASTVLNDSITKAALVKAAGLDSADERIKQMSATEILDRYFGKATQKTELSSDPDRPLIVEYVNDWRSK